MLSRELGHYGLCPGDVGELDSRFLVPNLIFLQPLLCGFRFPIPIRHYGCFLDIRGFLAVKEEIRMCLI